MRVLFYGYEYPPLGGGTGVAIKNLFEKFSKEKNLYIDFVTSSPNNKYNTEQIYKNITFYKVPTGIKDPRDYHTQKPVNMALFSWRAYWLTWKLTLENKYDLAHFFGFPGGLVPLLFRWRTPYIISLRGTDVPGYNDSFSKHYILYKPLSKLIWRFASKVITNSQGLASLAHKTSQNIKIDVIPNGVDINKFKPVPESDKFEKFSITTGGTRLIKRKGLKYLVKGFAKFYKEFPNSQLVLIGDGQERTNLQSLVEKRKIKPAVKFVGLKSNQWVQKNLPKFHVFCLPSLNEGMSNAALEALACGLPLILTNTGGTKEILKGNGFVIKKRSSNEIYDKLKKLYLNKTERIVMGKRSRELSRSMSWEKVAERYTNIYLTDLN